jgi:hypothetical protein
MKTVWALQDAKNRFSEMVDKTLTEGPQTVSRRGCPWSSCFPSKNMSAALRSGVAGFVFAELAAAGKRA